MRGSHGGYHGAQVVIPTPLDGVTLQRKADGAVGSLDESRTAILEFHSAARCAMVTGTCRVHPALLSSDRRHGD